MYEKMRCFKEICKIPSPAQCLIYKSVDQTAVPCPLIWADNVVLFSKAGYIGFHMDHPYNNYETGVGSFTRSPEAHDG